MKSCWPFKLIKVLVENDHSYSYVRNTFTRVIFFFQLFKRHINTLVFYTSKRLKLYSKLCFLFIMFKNRVFIHYGNDANIIFCLYRLEHLSFWLKNLVIDFVTFSTLICWDHAHSLWILLWMTDLMNNSSQCDEYNTGSYGQFEAIYFQSVLNYW
jgi:hypothetical protein